MDRENKVKSALGQSLRRNSKLFCFFRLGNEVILRFNKPCNRCPAITVDPAKAEKHPTLEPLRTLRSFRLVDPDEGDKSR